MTAYTTYYAGETYKCQTSVYNEGTLVDPESITCEILDPAGNSKDSGDMTKVSVGVYNYKYDLDDDASLGKWTAVLTATDSSGDVEIERIEFLVDSKQGTTIE